MNLEEVSARTAHPVQQCSIPCRLKIYTSRIATAEECHLNIFNLNRVSVSDLSDPADSPVLSSFLSASDILHLVQTPVSNDLTPLTPVLAHPIHPLPSLPLRPFAHILLLSLQFDFECVLQPILLPAKYNQSNLV
jgi:hypothetical protein